MVQIDTAARRSPRPISPAIVTRQKVASSEHKVAPAHSRVAERRRETANECDQLLLGTANRNCRDFERLYHLTSARLFATVRRSVWISSEAEEVLQEVYLKIWNGASAYDPEQASSITWMMRVARNHSIDHLRRCAGRRAHEVTLDGDQQVDDGGSFHSGVTPLDDSPRPDEWLEIQQNQRRFEQLIGSLGTMQRQVMVLAFRDGYTQADIAERLDAPLGSVKSWMRRALLNLKLLTDAPTSCNA